MLFFCWENDMNDIKKKNLDKESYIGIVFISFISCNQYLIYKLYEYLHLYVYLKYMLN